MLHSDVRCGIFWVVAMKSELCFNKGSRVWTISMQTRMWNIWMKYQWAKVIHFMSINYSFAMQNIKKQPVSYAQVISFSALFWRHQKKSCFSFWSEQHLIYILIHTSAAVHLWLILFFSSCLNRKQAYFFLTHIF